MIGSAHHLLAALHFICPLIFFTNLTRNPYISQIAILNIGLLAAAAWALWQQSDRGQWRFPRTRLDLPIAAWVAVCALSWLYAYFGHRPFYRDAMRAEGLRVFLFMLTNAVLVFYLAAAAAEDCVERPSIPVGRWAIFVVVWGGLWTFMPQLRSAPGPMNAIWANAFDPYGVLLWVGGLAGIIWLARSGTVHAVWHVALAVGFLAAVYGIAQYFGMEFLWPKVLNPYGGRSVSTFGNPNFMSSYLVMLLPLSVVYYLQADRRSHRVMYAAVLVALEAGLLCSLTRSSWAGALAALAPLLLSQRLRRLARKNLEFHGLVATAMFLIAVFWPSSTIGGYTSSMVGRIGEMKQIFQEGYQYSPWFQRWLIWMCGWTMGAENPILGKGWGLFELFYPFYQGHFLDHFDFYRIMRTHANNAHNEVVEVWAQTGIAGVGILFWLWTVFFRGLWADARPRCSAAASAEPEPIKTVKKKKQNKTVKEPPDNERIWLLAGGAGVCGMLVDNLLNVSLHFAVPAFLFWWQAGTVCGHLSARQGSWRSLRFPNRAAALAAAAVIVFGAVVGGWYWVGFWKREVHYFMGFKHMRRQNYADAIRDLSTAYRWNRFDVNNNYELGNAYARSEQPDKALWAYDEALKANAGYDEIYFNRATVIAGLGRPQEALGNYLISWAINPLSEQLYMSLSRFYFSDPSKYRREAVALLERGTHFFPDDVNFLNNLGYLYNLGKEYEKADKIYQDLLRKQPTMAVAEKNLRVSLRHSGKPPPEILKQVDEYRELETDLRAKRFGPDVLARARRVSEWFPDFMPAQLYRGNLELMNGRFGEAETVLRELVQKDPRNIAAQMNLGFALKQQNKRREATDVFRAILAQDPGNSRARAELDALSR
ncbi:MAG: tetratricopeptide repeat protein [Elusimicrobiota bacterium]